MSKPGTQRGEGARANAGGGNQDRTVVFQRVEFTNFKALERCTVHLRRMNVLVGANNCGKSTVVGAFRVLAAGLRAAVRQKPTMLSLPDGRRDLGWSVPVADIPVSLENAQTEFRNETALVRFVLSRDRSLVLTFPPDGGCLLFAEGPKGRPRTVAEFKREFPVSVGVVPVLGPVDDDEELVEEATVLRNLATHRAARNFRSYWQRFPAQFQEFAKLVRDTWEGMEVRAPELVPRPSRLHVTMMCEEERRTRELYWLGFGFQIWCQLLTHVVRNRGATILAVDEPETYLHPDVQRKLVHILRGLDAATVLATHSSEIVSEVEPDELVLLDGKRRKARRLDEAEDVQLVLDSIGSIQNTTLTRIAKTQRLLFVEGHDFMILSRLAEKLGLDDLAREEGLTVVPSGGFDSWQKIEGLAWGINQALGRPIAVGIVLDRDYRSDRTIDDVRRRLAQHLAFVHLHGRKELENYLLEEGPLRRVVEAEAARRRVKLKGDVVASFLEATEPLRDDLLDHYVVARRAEVERGARSEVTVHRELRAEFQARWCTFAGRADLIGGKNAFHAFSRTLQESYGISVSLKRVLHTMRPDEVPQEMVHLLAGLDAFRKAPTE